MGDQNPERDQFMIKFKGIPFRICMLHSCSIKVNILLLKPQRWTRPTTTLHTSPAKSERLWLRVLKSLRSRLTCAVFSTSVVESCKIIYIYIYYIYNYIVYLQLLHAKKH